MSAASSAADTSPALPLRRQPATRYALWGELVITGASGLCRATIATLSRLDECINDFARFILAEASVINALSCLPSATERGVELNERKRFALLRVHQVQLGSKEV